MKANARTHDLQALMPGMWFIKPDGDATLIDWTGTAGPPRKGDFVTWEGQKWIVRQVRWHIQTMGGATGVDVVLGVWRDVSVTVYSPYTEGSVI